MPIADRLIRICITVAVILLAAISFVISYRHAYSLAVQLGEDETTARMVPLTIDGMLLTSALAGLFCSRYNLPQPRLARFALLLGIGATITVNVAHGLANGPWAAVFAGWPAVALVIASKLLLWVVAASRSTDNRTVVTIEATDHGLREQLTRVVELIGQEPRISAAEIGRRLDLRYDEALRLTKEATGYMSTAQS